MDERIPRFSFQELRRLTRHLRKGGTRKGACGRAGIICGEFRRRFILDEKFARLLEKAETYALAGDEERLDCRVRKGDGQALLFRMRSVYGYGKNQPKGEERPTTDESSQACAAIEARVGALSLEERQAAV